VTSVARPPPTPFEVAAEFTIAAEEKISWTRVT